MDDFELLQRYQAGSDDAFALLVGRHLSAVYGIAFRVLRSAQLAEEVAFDVFADLAQHAPKVKPAMPLIAWLSVVTRRTAIDVQKRESRRVRREQRAFENLDRPLPAPRESIANRIHAALKELKAGDEKIIHARYFEEQELSAIAALLAVTPSTAQKRLRRALARLRAILQKPGALLLTIKTLATLFSSGVAQAAAEAGKIALMKISQKAAILALVAGTFTTTVLYQQSLLSHLRRDLRASRESLAQSEANLRTAEKQLARGNQEAADLRKRSEEVHRLRAELGELRKTSLHAANFRPADQTSVITDYVAGIERLKAEFAQNREMFIPEMQLISDREWLEAAILMLEARERGVEKAAAHLRTLAKGRYALQLNRALQKFVVATDGLLPGTVEQLIPHLDSGSDPSALARYDIVRTGRTNDLALAETVLREKPVASEFDSRFNISLLGAGAATPNIGNSDRTYGFSYSIDDFPKN